MRAPRVPTEEEREGYVRRTEPACGVLGLGRGVHELQRPSVHRSWRHRCLNGSWVALKWVINMKGLSLLRLSNHLIDSSIMTSDEKPS